MSTETNTEKTAPAPILDLSEVRMIQPEDGIYDDYANVLNIDWTLYDVRLRFGSLHYTTDPDNPKLKNQVGVIEERAAITIPWHQAKHLRDILSSVIKSYEDINGELKPINLPPAK
jgi:hypothetical protein